MNERVHAIPERVHAIPERVHSIPLRISRVTREGRQQAAFV